MQRSQQASRRVGAGPTGSPRTSAAPVTAVSGAMAVKVAASAPLNTGRAPHTTKQEAADCRNESIPCDCRERREKSSPRARRRGCAKGAEITEAKARHCRGLQQRRKRAPPCVCLSKMKALSQRTAARTRATPSHDRSPPPDQATASTPAVASATESSRREMRPFTQYRHGKERRYRWQACRSQMPASAAGICASPAIRSVGVADTACPRLHGEKHPFRPGQPWPDRSRRQRESGHHRESAMAKRNAVATNGGRSPAIKREAITVEPTVIIANAR